MAPPPLGVNLDERRRNIEEAHDGGTAKLVERLAKSLLHPQVSVEMVDFGSQPVSVMGAVNHPGVHQLGGRKTLAEVLALAGGTRPDAGPHVTISRQIRYGPIPLRSAKPDPTGDFSVAEVEIKELLSPDVKKYLGK